MRDTADLASLIEMDKIDPRVIEGKWQCLTTRRKWQNYCNDQNVFSDNKGL